jgi:predicted chitinase
MLISPPFLPPRGTGTEEQWLDAAMVGEAAGRGAFPVGYKFEWHGGRHLVAPIGDAGVALPVRAIADGTVVFLRQRTNADSPDAPLNYGAGYTSDAVVVIRHDTEIGANAAGVATAVQFYSVYMHLHTIPLTVTQGRPIYRKDEIGQAGHIYGVPNVIHFEICCDAANLALLVGCATGLLNLGANGRTDAVYGEMYFHLPAGTAIYPSRPLAQFVEAMTLPAATPAAPTPLPQPLAAVHTTTVDLAIGVLYAGGQGVVAQRGDAVVSTYQMDGTIVGAALREPEAEYLLYREAKTISEAYPETARPTISAVYELLRFGRIIGPDALAPADVPHWREVHYPGGRGWVNLNGANVHKYSDADFPQWKGWRLVDDDPNGDSRCDSPALRNVIYDIGGMQLAPNDQHAEAQLNNENVQRVLARTICQFPSEWDASTIDQRWGWLQTQSDENPEPFTAEEFAELRAHAQAVCFPLPELFAAQWCFDPKEFIRHFRKCGWLSLDELASTFPKYLFYNDTGNPRTAITSNNTTYTMTKARARVAVGNHRQALNFCLRKYVGATPQRIAIFLAQVMLETAQWRDLGGSRRLMHEWGFGAFSSANPATQHYSAFYGRGIMQLTWAGNYKMYGEFRQLPNHAGTYTERRTNQVPRITATSQHYDFNPNDNGVEFQWSPRYDPDIVGEQATEACDSGGFYWISKPFSEGSNINRVADRDYSTANIGFVNRLVNGGGNGYYERQAYTSFMLRTLSDSTATSGEETLTPPAPKATVRANMARAE